MRRAVLLPGMACDGINDGPVLSVAEGEEDTEVDALWNQGQSESALKA